MSRPVAMHVYKAIYTDGNQLDENGRDVAQMVCLNKKCQVKT